MAQFTSAPSAGAAVARLPLGDLNEKATDSVPGLDGGAILGHHRRPSICAYPARLRGVEVANWPPLPDGAQKHLDLITLHGGVEHTELFSALQADEYAQSIDMLPHAALLLHTWWLMKLSCEPHLANGKVGRNQPCPCGSGKKYKQCCLRGQQ